MPQTHTAIMLSITLPLVALAHYYIWARLVRDIQLPRTWHRLATGLIVLGGLNVPLMFALRRAIPDSRYFWVVWPASLWLGFVFLVLWPLFLADVWRRFVAMRARHSATPVDADRRLAMMRMVYGSVFATGGVMSAVAVHEAVTGPTVVRMPVSLTRLPKALTGLTVAQISDLHIAPLLQAGYVDHVVDLTMAQKPDVIVITGDLLDASVELMQTEAAALRGLKAPHGVFFVTGNHEYYTDVEAWLPILASHGIRVLRNERVAIGHGNDTFDLAGIDDLGGVKFGNGHGPDLQKALLGRDPARELVLLAHQPKMIYEAAEARVGLMLSGHTHGGQLWPFGYFVKLAQPFVQGLGQHGDTQIYVNPGTGYVATPMRFQVPAEITLLELRAV